MAGGLLIAIVFALGGIDVSPVRQLTRAIRISPHCPAHPSSRPKRRAAPDALVPGFKSTIDAPTLLGG